MSADKFDNFLKLLSERNFKIDENVPDTLKCGKCENLLNNSCTGLCLCKFCRHCIDGMLASGIKKCPGRKSECEHQMLSNFLPDNFSNFEISNLVLKCPNEMCPDECELINMEEHLVLCTNKLVTCPFYEFGCANNMMLKDEMHEHLQLLGYNHNKMLINLIGNLRNQVNELKRSNERKKSLESKNEPDIFQDFLTRFFKKYYLFVIAVFVVILVLYFKSFLIPVNVEKHFGDWADDLDNKVQQLTVEINGKCNNDQIESIKRENQELARQMETLEQHLQSKTNECILESNGTSSSDQIQSIKMENRELAQQMETLERNIDLKIGEKCVKESQLIWDVLFIVVVNVCMAAVLFVVISVMNKR